MKKKYIAAIAAFSMMLLAGCAGALVNEQSRSDGPGNASQTESADRNEFSSVQEDPSEPMGSQGSQITYMSVSEGNEFIDFEYIAEYSGTTDGTAIEHFIAKAEDFLLENYASAVNIEELDLTNEDMAKYIDENGKVIPVFQAAYTEDFDGDWEDESFLVVNMPKSDPPTCIRSYLFLAKGDQVKLVDEYFYGSTANVSLLDYGSVKHLIIGGEGMSGADSHTSLYGVKDGEAQLYYDIRGEYIKYKCFLSAFGWQGTGDLMYYDTVAGEYRIIAAEEIDIEEMLSLDSNGVLSASGYKDSPQPLFAYLVGGKYYLISRGAMDSGTPFIYENDTWTPVEEPGVRISLPDEYSGYRYVLDIDMGEAEAGMKPPIE